MEMDGLQKAETEKRNEAQESGENPMIRKRLFGRGIYGGKDVPIRLLDALIACAITATVVIIIVSALNGGFTVRFDSDGGSAVETQKLRYGDLLREPPAPRKPGYEFAGWQIAGTDTGWSFGLDTVTGDMTLTAQWKPARITVRLDPAGGSFSETALSADGSFEVKLTYGEPYGTLPEPVKEGFHFAGWEYSGRLITNDSLVETNGEHVLTAVWAERS